MKLCQEIGSKYISDKETKKWSKAHVFYGILDSRSVNSSFVKKEWIDCDYEWRTEMLNKAPNGRLIIKNSLFDSLKNSSKVYLAHITQNLDKILESGFIYPSGGCLVGSIYASLLFKEGDNLKMHNLGKYIFEKEAPKASKIRNNKNCPAVLIIEITTPPNKKSSLIGVDYTRLGSIHLEVYKEIESFLPYKKKIKINNIISDKIKNSFDFLSLIYNSYITGRIVESSVFFDLLNKTISHIPILGYLYFEAVSEYLMLYQDFNEAKKAHIQGELYNHSYKNLVFDIFPTLLVSGGLSAFKPTLKQLSDYIKRRKIIPQFDQKKIANYLVNRLTFLINSRLLNGGFFLENSDISKRDINNVSEIFPSLLGYLICDELRNYYNYGDFDKFEASQIWRYWNNMDVIVPFNGFIPKGEVGVNPAYPDLNYQIYLGRTYKYNDNLYVVPEKKLDIKILPKLADKKHTAMRL